MYIHFTDFVSLLPCAWADRLIVNQGHKLAWSSYNTTTQWLNIFTTHRIFLLSDALLMLHVEFPLVFIFCPLHCSFKCVKRCLCVWLVQVRARFVVAEPSKKKKHTRLARRVSSAGVAYGDTSLVKCNSSLCWCSVLSWESTEKFVPDIHSWSAASCLRLWLANSEASCTSHADSTSGKPVVTSCQSTLKHR